MYHELKTGAETGCDFTSRWFINRADGSNQGTLKDTKPRSIIPVDLNSIIAENAQIVSTFYKDYLSDEVASEAKHVEYGKLSADVIDGIQNLLWNEEEGIWFDYDLINEKQRKYFALR